MVQLVTGPMGAGKSQFLINYHDGLKIENKRVMAFKPKSDTRTKNTIKSRNGREIFAIEVRGFYGVIDVLLNSKKPDAVIIDEVQFFDKMGFEDLFHLCKRHDINLLLGGIDLTSELKPFKTIKEISPYCTHIIKLEAKCHYCGGRAHYTKCTIEKTKDVLVGDDIYVATCYKCHNGGKKSVSN